MSTSPAITVVGAGVIGLSAAILAQEAGYHVTILSAHFPCDGLSIAYTSCWAGAHLVSVATADQPELHAYDRETFEVLAGLLESDENIPVMMRQQTELRQHVRIDGIDQLTLLERFHPDFRMLRLDELPEGVTHGATFKTIFIDTPHYLNYLIERFTKAGGHLVRAKLDSLTDVLSPSLQLTPYNHDSPVIHSLVGTSAIINCTGIGARALSNGDANVYPTRGQTVLVRAPWVNFGITRTGREHEGIYTYIIPRKSGDVIIGGTADVDDWEERPRAETTKMIKERAIELCPELLPIDKRAAMDIDDLVVISENAGLRPSRRGGIRIDSEMIGSTVVVNCYGHGGGGYQGSWGSVRVAVDLLKVKLPIV